MENQLLNIFDKQIQAKRVYKQIDFTHDQQIRSLLDCRFSFIRKQQFMVHITLKNKFIKKYKLSQKIKTNVLLRITYLATYPLVKPRIYFISDNVNQLFTVNTRDYFEYYFPDWTSKNNLQDIVFRFSEFYNRIQNQKQLNKIGEYHKDDFVQIQPLYNQKCSEFYPIQMLINEKIIPTFLIINKFDIIMLANTITANYLRLVDVFPIQSIKNILKSKYFQNKIIIMIKWEKYDGGFQFCTSDHQNIIDSIVQKKNSFVKQYNNNTQPIKKIQNSETPKISSPKKPTTKNSLTTINQKIQVAQQLYKKQPQKQNLNKLIQFYQQAIQYCSLYNQQACTQYLTKLQKIITTNQNQAIDKNNKSNNNKVASKPLKTNELSQQSIFEFFKQTQKQSKIQTKKNTNTIDLL